MVWIHNGSPELDAQSNYKTILAVCIALPILTTTIVSLRAYTRAVILKVLGIDDFIIFFSAVCGIVYSGLCIGQSRWGLGLNLKQRPPADLDEYSVINFAGRPFYMFGILGFKVALCFAYLRIMKTSVHPIYKAVTWTVMILCTIGHVAGTLVLIFQCSPVVKSWKPLTHGTCLPNDSTFYALAAVTIAFDVIIFLLPIPLLVALNISNRKKFALVFVFMLGLLTTVCSILRMVQIGTIAKSGNSTMLVLWGVVELNVGVTLTCIPTLGPLFPYFRSTTQGTPSRSYKLSNYGRSHEGTAIRRQSRFASMHAGKYSGDSDLSDSGIHVLDAPHTMISDDLARLNAPQHNGLSYDPRNGDEEILKTTDINVHVDSSSVAQAQAQEPRRW